MTSKPSPPGLARRLLEKFLRDDLAEEVTGDLRERFHDDLKTMTPRAARWRYWLEVIQYIRPFALRKFNPQLHNPIDMFGNNLIISWRNLRKRGAYSSINIGGLSLGIVSFLLLTGYVTFQKSYESFHANADNIYRITVDLYRGNEYLMTDCEMYAPTGPLAKAQMPEVVDFVRMMNHDDRRIKVGTKVFVEEQSYLADSSVFNVFTYHAVAGSLKHSLSKPFQAVMTESAAKRYFGRTDVVDEIFETGGREYVVTAVISDVPPNTHLKFDFLLSHVSQNAITQNRYNDENWDTGNNEYTYFLVAPGTDLNAFNKKLAAWSEKFKDKIGSDRFQAERIRDIHLHSHKTFEPDTNGNADVVNALLFVAYFILALAWVNYINLSTAKSLERAREVGIRKVMGSKYIQLVSQFLTESVMINVSAAMLALLILKASLPYFRQLAGIPSLVFFESASFWTYFAGATVIGIVISGSYPAFVLSSFEPVLVLKGRLKNSSHGQWLRKGLVVFQFTATTVLVICLFTIFRQLNYLKDADLGMNIHQTLVIKGPAVDSLYARRFETFRNAMMQHPSVHHISLSTSIPGSGRGEVSTTQSVYRVGKDKTSGSFNYTHYGIDAEFLPTYSMQLLAGDNFRNGSDNQDLVIINDEARKALGFATPEEAIGSRITYYTRWPSDGSTVTGVIKDFYQWSPKEPAIPMIFRYATYPQYITLNMETSAARDVIEVAGRRWKEVFAMDPFSYFFSDERYNQQYNLDEQLSRVLTTFAILAILIACLGLFGLSSYTILQRTKEIGIRKVLGGSVTGIVRLLSVDFVKLVLLAAVIATPLSYFLCAEYLSNYSTRISMRMDLFALPFVTVILVALLTISIQTIRAAKSNPADVLKNE